MEQPRLKVSLVRDAGVTGRGRSDVSLAGRIKPWEDRERARAKVTALGKDMEGASRGRAAHLKEKGKKEKLQPGRLGEIGKPREPGHRTEGQG